MKPGGNAQMIRSEANGYWDFCSFMRSPVWCHCAFTFIGLFGIISSALIIIVHYTAKSTKSRYPAWGRLVAIPNSMSNDDFM